MRRGEQIRCVAGFEVRMRQISCKDQREERARRFLLHAFRMDVEDNSYWPKEQQKHSTHELIYGIFYSRLLNGERDAASNADEERRSTNAKPAVRYIPKKCSAKETQLSLLVACLLELERWVDLAWLRR